jgi:hypothetical protein
MTKEGKKTIFTKPFSFWLKLSLAAVLFWLTIPAVFYYCYLFGHRILEGNLLGGDSAFHLSWIYTLKRYFPRIPLWFPFGGSGGSIVLGYWVFSYYLTIIGNHLTGLTIEQVMRLVEFLSVPLVCLEIYLYLWIRFKNQIMATIGAFLYPLSSVAWGWVSHGGFFGMQVSTTVYLPAFLFFDLYLETELVQPEKLAKKRLYLLGFSIFSALGALVHGNVLPCLFLGLPVYVLFRSQFQPRKKEKRLLSLIKGVKALVLAGILAFLAASYLLLPQLGYFSFQARQQPFVYTVEETPYLPWQEFLGFKRLNPLVGSLYTPLFLSVLVSSFALAGVFWGLFKRKFVGALGIMALFYVGWLSSAKFLAAHYPFLLRVIMPTSNRAASITAIYLTILAAYGLWSVADLPGALIRFFSRKITPEKGKTWISLGLKNFSFLVSLVLVIFLCRESFYRFRPLQTYSPWVGKWGLLEAYFGYGSLGLQVPLCRVPGWENLVAEKETCRDYEPDFILDRAEVDRWGKGLAEKTKELDLGRLTRASVSPYLPSVIYSFAAHTEASLVQMIGGLAHTNLAWQGIHDQTLFLEEGKTAGEVAEMAKWFGLRYVFLPEKSKIDLAPRYPEAVWPLKIKVENVLVREFKEIPGLATLSTKPAILVIGSEKDQSFFMVFRNAIKGGLSFDQALLVQGKVKIDDYSLEELNQFPAVVLYGYSYRNQAKAWNLLGDYLKGGGAVFIETGWQYVGRDWGKLSDDETGFLPINLPEPLPIEKTAWGNIGFNWQKAAFTSQLGKDLNLKNFGSLDWDGGVWGMALAQKTDLRSWAEPVLSVGDQVVIARGNYGRGRIVWSGMNLFSHAYAKESREEYYLVEDIFKYLLKSDKGERGEVLINWDYPDRIELSLAQVPTAPSFLYWAGTYTPNWRAYLLKNGRKEQLEVYRAGPGFKAVRLNGASAGDKVIFEYSLKKILVISFGISSLVFLLLIFSVLDAWLWHQQLERKLTGDRGFSLEKLGSLVKGKISKAIKWDEEED